MQQLKDRVGSIVVGDPRERETFFGPLIDRKAKDTFVAAVRQAIGDGGTIEAGGEVLTGPPYRKRILRQADGGYRAPTKSSAPEQRIIRAVPYRQHVQIPLKKQSDTQTRRISALPQVSSRKTPLNWIIFSTISDQGSRTRTVQVVRQRCVAGLAVLYRLECERFRRAGVRGGRITCYPLSGNRHRPGFPGCKLISGQAEAGEARRSRNKWPGTAIKKTIFGIGSGGHLSFLKNFIMSL